MRMPRLFTSICLGLLGCIPVSAFAQWNLENGLSIRHAVFQHPESGPYLEAYFNIHGRSLRFQEVSPKRFQSSAAITILLKDGEKVVDYLKYRLESPLVSDTTDIDFALTDLKRLNLPKSGLELEIIVEDFLRPGNTNYYVRSITTDFSVLPAFSDIEFIDEYHRVREAGNFTRNGMDLIPYAVNFYPTERNKLIFYSELYGADEGHSEPNFLLTYSIRERGSEEINPNFWQYQKASVAGVIPSLREFDITDLPTGNYEVVTEIRDKQNQVLLSKRAFFQRMNNRAVEKLENIAMLDVANTWAERYNTKQLNSFLDFIQPVAEPHEQNLIVSLQGHYDSTLQQRFLFNFWLQRDTLNPYQAWLTYLENVKKVNDQYSTTSALGYRTDRGRVMLEYGEHNDIISRVNEPGAAPYEIWQYYTLPNGQTNIRFVFYEPTRVTNNYQLIHSNAIGELQDQRWQMRVYGPSANPSLLNNFDVLNPQNSFGGNAGQLENDAGGSILNQGRP